MTFDEYNNKAGLTASYGGTPLEQLSYVSIALGGEVGEYLNEYKKHLRAVVNKHDIPDGGRRTNMLLELGDTLWYLSRAAHALDSSLDEVAAMNLDKLAVRYNVGKA